MRRNKVSQLNYGDFDPLGQELAILGKGKSAQTEIMGLSPATTQAVLNWTESYQHNQKKDPLFVANRRKDPVELSEILSQLGDYEVNRHRHHYRNS